MTQNISPSNMLSTEEIKNRLTNYEQISDTQHLVYNNKIIYFEILPNGKYKFKPGGNLIVNKHPVYIVLSNGKKTWSVQLDKHIIFREIDLDSIKKKYEEIIKDKDKQIKELLHMLKAKQ